MTPELESVTFRRVHPPVGWNVPALERQIWELLDPSGRPFGRAEVLPGEEKWRVVLVEQATAIDSTDLVKLVAKLLLWEVSCPADSVEVFLPNRPPLQQTHVLVKTGGEYV